MNEQDTKANQEQTESIEDLELTSEQAAVTKAGVTLATCLVSGYSLSSGADRPVE